MLRHKGVPGDDSGAEPALQGPGRAVGSRLEAGTVQAARETDACCGSCKANCAVGTSFQLLGGPAWPEGLLLSA